MRYGYDRADGRSNHHAAPARTPGLVPRRRGADRDRARRRPARDLVLVCRLDDGAAGPDPPGADPGRVARPGGGRNRRRAARRGRAVGAGWVPGTHGRPGGEPARDRRDRAGGRARRATRPAPPPSQAAGLIAETGARPRSPGDSLPGLTRQADTTTTTTEAIMRHIDSSYDRMAIQEAVAAQRVL